MQPNEAFKLGFMSRCVEEGLSEPRIRELVKTAFEWPYSARDIIGGVTGGIKDSILPVLGLAAGVPMALGGGAAYLANKATDTDDADVDEYKQTELTDTYKRMAEQLRRKRELRNYKSDRQRTGQIFL